MTYRCSATISAGVPINVMRWLYRLQQRLSLTPFEGRALTLLLFLLFAGLVARHIQGDPGAVVTPEPHAVRQDTLASGTGARGGEAHPASSSEAASPAPASNDAGPAAPIDLNAATSAQLQTLPRIGPAIAQRILDYRAANGPFEHVQDLANVRGIGPKTLAGLQEMVTVKARAAEDTR